MCWLYTCFIVRNVAVATFVFTLMQIATSPPSGLVLPLLFKLNIYIYIYIYIYLYIVQLCYIESGHIVPMRDINYTSQHDFAVK